jgi:hypothetical protein
VTQELGGKRDGERDPIGHDRAGSGSAQGQPDAFSGAGPLFGTMLAEEFVIREIVVSKHAGNFSA